ncbi:hypothetical protein GF550_13700, partial [Staphylococcus aureus]|nr:hypothetical protein [Staphylococcus aureus]
MKTKEELRSEISDIKRQIDLKVKYATRALNNDELESWCLYTSYAADGRPCVYLGGRR